MEFGEKLLVIGIDGATRDVIRPNIETLPTFRKLMKDEKKCDFEMVKKDILRARIFLGRKIIW